MPETIRPSENPLLSKRSLLALAASAVLLTCCGDVSDAFKKLLGPGHAVPSGAALDRERAENIRFKIRESAKVVELGRRDPHLPIPIKLNMLDQWKGFLITEKERPQHQQILTRDAKLLGEVEKAIKDLEKCAEDLQAPPQEPKFQ